MVYSSLDPPRSGSVKPQRLWTSGCSVPTQRCWKLYKRSRLKAEEMAAAKRALRPHDLVPQTVRIEKPDTHLNSILYMIPCFFLYASTSKYKYISSSPSPFILYKGFKADPLRLFAVACLGYLFGAKYNAKSISDWINYLASWFLMQSVQFV